MKCLTEKESGKDEVGVNKEEFEVKGRCLVVHLKQEVDHHYAEQLVKNVNYLMDKYMVKNVLFDFEKVGFMDSSGIGMVVGRCKKTKNLGGQVVVCNMSERVNRILRISGVYRLVEKKKGITEALQELMD